MKRPNLLVLIGLLATSSLSYAQTNAPAGDSAAPEATTIEVSTNAPAAEAASTTENSNSHLLAQNTQANPAEAAPTNTPPADAAPVPPPTNAPATDAVAQPPTTPPAEAPGTPPTTIITPGATPPSEAVIPGAVIPLIVMDDVPLTDAIKNLARQAGLNYMLDPKIQFGQPGPDGKITPQPNVSIRWENVTAEQALAALLNNYSLQLAEDPRSKIARIGVKDPAAPPALETRIIQLKYASPTNIVSAVQSILTDKRSKVVPDVRTSQLVILATENEMAAIDEMVQRLDTQTKQVLIEARLLETSWDPTTKKGIDWSGTLEGQHVSYGNGILNPANSRSTTTIPGQSSGTLPSGRPVPGTPNHSVTTVLESILGTGGLNLNTASGLTPNIGFLSADGVNAVLSFINKEADAKTISAPRTVTLDNEPAKIEVTRATPIVNITAGTANTTGGSQIQYTNLGIILHVTPRISANDFVNLKVIPEVSRVADTQRKTVGSAANGAPQTFDVDLYDIRKMETRVMIPSGNTLVLGGLIQDDVRNQNTKVPILGDIPVLGWAFRSEQKTRAKKNLTIFLTPTIVGEEDYQPTHTDYLKTPVPTQDYLEGNWTAWDSAIPMDWSKPAVASSPKAEGTYR